MSKLQQDPRQSSFGAGEVGPEMYGRTDFKKYESALRRCRNGIVTPRGAWANRPGTQMVKEAEYGALPVRLVPFTFANGQNYVLEFGQTYVAIIQNGAAIAQVGVPLGRGTATYYVTPYAAADLSLLKFAQSGDVITIVHPNYVPQQLKRLAANGTAWSIDPISFTRPADAFTGLTGPLKFISQFNTPGDPTHPLKPWQWVVTTILNGVESRPTAILQNGVCAVDPTAPAVIGTTNTLAGPVIGVLVNIYRGKEGVFGLAGVATGDTIHGFTYTDEGVSPDFSLQPPASTDPFAGLVAGQYPTNVTYYKQRLIFTAGGKVWASAVGDYTRFDEYAGAAEDGAFSFNIASQGYEEVRNFLPMRVLLALTNAEDWAISGAFSKTSIDAAPNNVRGSSWLDPVKAGATALYVQDGLASIYELSYSFAEQSYLGNDVTLLAYHLFSKHTIKDIAYAQSPNSIVWAARDDGILLGCTYIHEQEMVAWHWHDTQGAFESVCAVQEGIETAVYVVARRQRGNTTTYRYIERFASRALPRIADGSAHGKIDTAKGVFLDSSRTYSGAPATHFSNLDHLEGLQVGVLADGQVLGPYTVAAGAIDISVELPDGAAYVTVGLPYVAEGEQLAVPLKSNVKIVQRVQFEVIESRGLWWGQDFDHLKEWEQRDVKNSYDAVAPYSGTDHVRIPGTYNHEGRVVWRVTDPLPVTVVGITRELDVGGD